MKLQTQPNIKEADSFYEELISAQRDLDDNRQQIMNARLILTLANHIGNREILSEAIKLASV